MALSIAFATLMVVIFGYGVYEARDFPLLARLFPYSMSLVALCLALAQLAMEMRNYFLRTEEVRTDFADLAPDQNLPPAIVYRRALRYLAWILGLYSGIWLAGFVIAVAGFLLTFLRFEANLTWPKVATLTLAGFLFVVGISWVMALYWPEGLILRWVDLPWPLS